ncbi:MAG: PAS domain S-box protein, partial [Gammaproteobacteria bacterium]|nr:PAS domain S-box protein [Gammaproteobacteria bacterium]
MDNANTDNRVAQLEQQLHLLVEATHRLNQELSVPVICKTLVEYGLKLVDATAGGAGILKDEQMHFKKYYRDGSWHPIDLSFKPGEGVPGWITENLIPYISHDALNDAEVIPEVQQALGFITLVTIPITDKHGTLIGCLELHDKANEQQFDQQDVQILEGLAASAAIAINNARMVSQQIESQQVLQRSEERYITGQRFANIGTWDWNIETGELHWSEQIAPLFGYAVGELETTYDNFLSAVHNDDRQAVSDAVNACVEHGADYNIEHRVVWPDGTTRWVLERGDTLRDEFGKAIRMLGVVQDITHRIELEAALRQQRNFAEGMIDTAQTIVLVLDTDGMIIRFNPYLETISGYKLDEVIGKDWFQYFLPVEDQESLRQLFREALKDNQTKGNVNAIVTKSGEHRQIEWYDKTLKNRDGEIIGLLAIGQDITERKRAEDELRLAAMVLENTPEGVMITDPQLNVISINPAFSRTTGYSAEEMIGERPTILSSGRHDNAFYQAMWSAIAETDRWQGEIWNRRKDGEIYPEWLNINAIKDESGNIT